MSSLELGIVAVSDALVGNNGSIPKFGPEIHHPKGTRLLAETEAGPVYRIPFGFGNVSRDDEVEIPGCVLLATVNNKERKKLNATLNLNSRIGPVGIGRPNSAFVMCVDNGFVLDHLAEFDDHVREGSPVLHNLLRGVYEKMGVKYQQRDLACPDILSGHLAPLTISTKTAAYVLLLDAFKGSNTYEKLPLRQQLLIQALYGIRVIPLTADCHIIRLPKRFP